MTWLLEVHENAPTLSVPPYLGVVVFLEYLGGYTDNTRCTIRLPSETGETVPPRDLQVHLHCLFESGLPSVQVMVVFLIPAKFVLMYVCIAAQTPISTDPVRYPLLDPVGFDKGQPSGIEQETWGQTVGYPTQARQHGPVQSENRRAGTKRWVTTWCVFLGSSKNRNTRTPCSVFQIRGSRPRQRSEDVSLTRL